MARKCKCVICKKELTTDTAYKVAENNKNRYYCSEEEYSNLQRKKQSRKDMIDNIYKILGYEEGMILPPILIKKIEALGKFYPYSVISECFSTNSDSISYWWNLEGKFKNEFGKASYIMRIIENSINDIYSKWKIKEQIEKKNLINKSNTSIIDIDYKPKKRKDKDISNFLD